MPGRDGTGPLGNGAMTGRGLGLCSGRDAKIGAGFGMGSGFRRGCRRYWAADMVAAKPRKEMLEEQKKFLESRLSVINQELEN